MEDKIVAMQYENPILIVLTKSGKIYKTFIDSADSTKWSEITFKPATN